jgi:hypothetical protein
VKNVNTSEKASSISEIYQLLQTIHKKLFSNNQITSQFDQEEASFCLK